MSSEKNKMIKAILSQLAGDDEEKFLVRSYKLTPELKMAFSIFSDVSETVKKKIQDFADENSETINNDEISDAEKERITKAMNVMADAALQKKKEFWEKLYADLPKLNRQMKLRINPERGEVEVYNS